MNEANSLETAQSDAKKLYKQIEDGALHDQISRAVIRKILFHIKSFGQPRALDLAIETAKKRITAPTFSEQLTARCVSIVTRSINALHPEDGRALGLWLIGTPPQVPGFLKHAITALGETSGTAAVERAETYVTGLLQRLQRVDEELFQDHIKALTMPRQRIIRGLLLDAQWAFQERDGVTARQRILSARKLAKKWLRDHVRRQQQLAG